MIELSPERVRELSAQARSNVETKANDKDDTRWWIPDHYDQEFARLIIHEVLTILEQKTIGATRTSCEDFRGGK